jgi:hypothetical protein
LIPQTGQIVVEAAVEGVDAVGATEMTGDGRNSVRNGDVRDDEVSMRLLPPSRRCLNRLPARTVSR